MRLQFAEPPAKAARLGRPAIRRPFLMALAENPNQWAIYPTKSKTKTVYNIGRTLRTMATEMGLSIEIVYDRQSTKYTMYVRVVNSET